VDSKPVAVPRLRENAFVPDDFTKHALARIDAFIAEHPEYTRSDFNPSLQGGTNRVVLGRRGNERIVFKVFCEAERKQRECFALRHWRETGLVPGLLADAGPDMIVTTRVPGTTTLHGMHGRVTNEDEWREACGEMGRAVASLMAVPMSATARTNFESRVYGGLGPLEAYLGRIVDLARGVQRRDPDFRDGYWASSLGFFERLLPSILAEPRTLYHQDPANHFFDGRRFAGFYDLEMCRVGGPAMQLSYCTGVLNGSADGWAHFRAGWESAGGCALDWDACDAIAAAVHLLGWRVITRYMSYDGTPGSGYGWAGPADPARYRRLFDEAESMLGVRRTSEKGEA
jgi:aminoglycoside phosphotransferase (APT) family kinase protein